MKTQPPFSLDDSWLTQQELQFYSHSPEGSVGRGDTQETRGEGLVFPSAARKGERWPVSSLGFAQAVGGRFPVCCGALRAGLT